jgi:hypothetical protein
VPSSCHSWMVSSGTLSSAATSSVVKGTLRLSAGYVGDDWVHKRDQCRWFGGMVGNHVADIVAKYGDTGEVPQALTDYIKGREATTTTSMAAQGTSTLLLYRTRGPLLRAGHS